jgi:hypothetical protein
LEEPESLLGRFANSKLGTALKDRFPVLVRRDAAFSKVLH